MAKSKMKVNYKTKKREKNKNKKEEKVVNEGKSMLITFSAVIVFLAIVYLGAIGLEKLGVFEAGYTKPTSEPTISYEEIIGGEVFNRDEKEYVVLFDTYGDNTYDVYVKYLASKYEDARLYTVDMSNPANKNYISEDSNIEASKPSELKINDITIIRIKNGKIVKYITGSDEIVEYLN